MSDNFETSLINLGELSKPATVLVEKISEAVGGIFRPYEIVRVAKAEAHADRVRADSQIEISDLQRRAFHRFLNEEAKKQQNIEEITQKALPLLEGNSRPNEVEDDWITHFFDRGRLISDEEMQSLWSRVLAGETNSPGTYSKRTVNFLSALDKDEAELFTGLCRFCWKSTMRHVRIIFDEWNEIYECLVEPNTLNILEGIGLIQYESSGFVGAVLGTEFSLNYFGKEIIIDVSPSGTFKTGRVILTKVGEELAPICESKPIEGFYEYVISAWRRMGYSIVSAQ